MEIENLAPLTDAQMRGFRMMVLSRRLANTKAITEEQAAKHFAAGNEWYTRLSADEWLNRHDLYWDKVTRKYGF